jgi:RNA polymerase sigma-70 factor (ECF subfamily)
MEEKTEQQVLEESVTDPGQFDEIVSRYYDPLFRYASKTLGDADLAGDIAEEALLRCFEQRAKLARAGKGCRSWLYRVATNLMMSSFEARAAAQRYVERAAPSWSQLTEQAENMTEQVLEALAQCTPAERVVVTLRYFEGMSDNETALATGKTSASVRVTLHRALEHMRRFCTRETRSC